MKRANSSLTEVFVHALVWVAAIGIPPLLSYLNGEAQSDPMLRLRTLRMLPTVLGYMLIFYFNYFWLVDRMLFSKKIPQFLFVNLGCIIALVMMSGELQDRFFSNFVLRIQTSISSFGTLQLRVGPPPTMRFLLHATIHTMVVGAAVAIKATKRSYRMQSKIDDLEKNTSQAELQQLKSQLNPHFLFNSLNNIYALIAFDQDRAQLAMHNLSDMLRYQLYEANKEEIPLRKEIDFVRHYCDLMRLRMPANVRVELHLPDKNEDIDNILIAPLLFITSVENAFKHGISPTELSYISISISATRQHVRCMVRNSRFPKADTSQKNSGIGLVNLRKRLDLLYPGQYTWINNEMETEYFSEITIIVNS